MTLLRQSHLDEAVAAGIITVAQAQALADLAADGGARPRPSDERFIVVNNFNEVFVSVGLLILVAAAHVPLRFAAAGWEAAAASALAAGVAWLFAEYFVFRRRMMLPSIVAALSVVHFAVEATLAALAGAGRPASLEAWEAQAVGIAALALILARFRVPFLVLPLAVAIAAVTLWRGGGLSGDGSTLALAAACGLAFVAVAVWFDLRDPARLKRQSQFAFWLYVAGSPLLVHPLFWAVIQPAASKEPSWVLAAAIVPVALVVTLAGLVLDRRSFIVSTLAYVAIVVGIVLGKAGTAAAGILFGTLAVIGLYVILLGVGWRTVRRAVLSRLPLGALASRLSPVT